MQAVASDLLPFHWLVKMPNSLQIEAKIYMLVFVKYYNKSFNAQIKTLLFTKLIFFNY